MDALPCFVADKNVDLFARHKVFSREEMVSRYEILLENYQKVLHIEALTMLDMARKDILPAVENYIRDLSDTALSKKTLSPQASCTVEEELVTCLSALCSCVYHKAQELDRALLDAHAVEDTRERAARYHDMVFTLMQELRAAADEMELHTAAKYWPFPTYGDLLFRV